MTLSEVNSYSDSDSETGCDDVSESIQYEHFNSNDNDDGENDNARNSEAFVDNTKHVIYKRVRTAKYKNDGTVKQCNYDKKINVYSTRPTPGSCIRDPVHGTFSKYKVGSRDEYYYFKVRMADIYTLDRTPLTLFYDSPESYEKHMYTKVSPEIKNNWRNMYRNYSGVESHNFGASKNSVVK